MKCFGNGGQCQSESHLKRDCPHESGKGNGRGSTSSSVNYVESYERLFMVTIDADDYPTTRIKTTERNEESIFMMWDDHTPQREDDDCDGNKMTAMESPRLD